VESQGRFSDHEVHTFYPDCPSEFIFDHEIHAWLLLFWHVPVPGQSNGTNRCFDIHLLLGELKKNFWSKYYGPNTMPREDWEDGRTMRRLGLVKTEYAEDQMRDVVDVVNEEHMWRFVRLV
jgi:hypothetical protein